MHHGGGGLHGLGFELFGGGVGGVEDCAVCGGLQVFGGHAFGHIERGQHKKFVGVGLSFGGRGFFIGGCCFQFFTGGGVVDNNGGGRLRQRLGLGRGVGGVIQGEPATEGSASLGRGGLPLLRGLVPFRAVCFNGFAVGVGGATVADNGQAVGNLYQFETLGGCFVAVAVGGGTLAGLRVGGCGVGFFLAEVLGV